MLLLHLYISSIFILCFYNVLTACSRYKCGFSKNRTGKSLNTTCMYAILNLCKGFGWLYFGGYGLGVGMRLRWCFWLMCVYAMGEGVQGHCGAWLSTMVTGGTYVVAARGSCQLRFGASAVTARVFGPRAWLRGL
jgi:hypothetical protein